MFFWILPGAHKEIRRRLRGSAAQRIFFAGQGALGAVSGARGAGDATASTGPTNSGPGPAVAGIWHIRHILLLAAAASKLPPSDAAFPGSDLLCKPKARLALLRLSKPASAIAVA